MLFVSSLDNKKRKLDYFVPGRCTCISTVQWGVAAACWMHCLEMLHDKWSGVGQRDRHVSACKSSIHLLSVPAGGHVASSPHADKQTRMLTFTASIYSAQLILITCLWSVEAGAARGNQLVHGENMQNVDANKTLSHISSCLYDSRQGLSYDFLGETKWIRTDVISIIIEVSICWFLPQMNWGGW